MKKIVIVSNKMVIGGIETSLIELMKELIKRYEITLILNSFEGELFESIPHDVKIIKMYNFNSIYSRIKYEKGISNKINILKKYIYLRLTKSYDKQCRILTNLYPVIDEQYDLAIAYSTPISLPNYYVINNIYAKKKIIFIHNDMKEISLSPYESKNLFYQFDKIFAVSYYAKKSFVKFYPSLVNKIDVFYNLIDINNIMIKSREKIYNVDSNYLKICTVGRLEYEKGQDIIPNVIEELKNRKIDVRWYIVGDGTLKEKIKTNAKKRKILENIIFTGYQNNPYKYIKNCDIYVQTSRQEGFGITLLEAKILKKLIITTDFPCAYEHIRNYENGIIVKFNYKALANAINNLIENEELKEKIISNLKVDQYSKDTSLIDQIFK